MVSPTSIVLLQVKSVKSCNQQQQAAGEASRMQASCVVSALQGKAGVHARDVPDQGE